MADESHAGISYAFQIIGIIMGIVLIIYGWKAMQGKNKGTGFMAVFAGLMVIVAGSWLGHMMDPEAVNPLAMSLNATTKLFGP